MTGETHMHKIRDVIPKILAAVLVGSVTLAAASCRVWVCQDLHPGASAAACLLSWN